MRTLIAEDDLTNRIFLHELLRGHGPIDVAMHGREAVDAVAMALREGRPYDLVCLDVMMPEMDGQDALRAIRALELAGGHPAAKILMTTALRDATTVMTAFREQADGYLVKPIDRAKLLGYLAQFQLVDPAAKRA